MTAEGLEEDKEMSSWALEVHHVYPMKEVRLGGQHVNVSGSTIQWHHEVFRVFLLP
jgi:hypothetical protein